jgi:DNA polymerase-3 subunit epsilon
MRRSLDRIRAEGRGVDLVDLARRLLAVSGPLDLGIARRLLATALDCPEEALPERLEPAHLGVARHGGSAPVGLSEASFAVVDLETTGLSVDRCAILEIGAVRIQKLRISGRFQTLVDPGGPVPASIKRLTGIDDALVVGAPSPAQAMRAFCTWLGETPQAIFVAHNAAFDERFVRRALEDHGLPPLAAPVLCTRRLARRLVPDLRRYGLDRLSAHFGISNGARHRALGDADATARVLLDLLALAAERGNLSTVGALLDLQSRAPERPARRRARPSS